LRTASCLSQEITASGEVKLYLDAELAESADCLQDVDAAGCMPTF
jgi:hypothetical protein